MEKRGGRRTSEEIAKDNADILAKLAAQLDAGTADVIAKADTIITNSKQNIDQTTQRVNQTVAGQQKKNKDAEKDLLALVDAGKANTSQKTSQQRPVTHPKTRPVVPAAAPKSKQKPVQRNPNQSNPQTTIDQNKKIDYRKIGQEAKDKYEQSKVTSGKTEIQNLTNPETGKDTLDQKNKTYAIQLQGLKKLVTEIDSERDSYEAINREIAAMEEYVGAVQDKIEQLDSSANSSKSRREITKEIQNIEKQIKKQKTLRNKIIISHNDKQDLYTALKQKIDADRDAIEKAVLEQKNTLKQSIEAAQTVAPLPRTNADVMKDLRNSVVVDDNKEQRELLDRQSKDLLEELQQKGVYITNLRAALKEDRGNLSPEFFKLKEQEVNEEIGQIEKTFREKRQRLQQARDVLGADSSSPQVVPVVDISTATGPEFQQHSGVVEAANVTPNFENTNTVTDIPVSYNQRLAQYKEKNAAFLNSEEELKTEYNAIQKKQQELFNQLVQNPALLSEEGNTIINEYNERASQYQEKLKSIEDLGAELSQEMEQGIAEIPGEEERKKIFKQKSETFLKETENLGQQYSALQQRQRELFNQFTQNPTLLSEEGAAIVAEQNVRGAQYEERNAAFLKTKEELETESATLAQEDQKNQQQSEQQQQQEQLQQAQREQQRQQAQRDQERLQQEEKRRIIAEKRREIQERLNSIGIVNVDHLAQNEARDAAEKNLTEEKESLKGVRGFFKKIWKHNLAKEYYRQKEIATVKKSIYEDSNIYTGQQKSIDVHNTAMSAITDRFIADYEGLIRQDSGEQKRLFNEQISPEAQEIKSKITDLIKDYAQGNIDDEVFAAERGRILSRVTAANQDIVGAGEMYADNMKEVAMQLRNALDHGVSLDSLDFNFDLTVGKAQSSIRTEAQYTRVDKVIEKLNEKMRGVNGMLVNETTVAIGVGLATSLLAGTAKSAARGVGKLSGFVGGIAVAGAIGGMKENFRMKMDRAQHLRERAKGETIVAGSERREALEGSVYNMVRATDLQQQLESIDVYDINVDPDAIIELLAEVEARISIANRRKIDLISYSSSETVEQERSALEILHAKKKAQLRQYMPGSDSEYSFDELLAQQTRVIRETLLEGDISQKDKAFRSLKRKEVAKAFAKTALSAAIIGGTIQEGMAFAKDYTEGIVEHYVGNNHNAEYGTPLEILRRHIENPHAPAHAPKTLRDIPWGNNDGSHQEYIRVPQNAEIVDHGNGTVDIIKDGDTVAKNIPFVIGKDGAPTPETIAALAKAHIVDVDTTQTIEKVVQSSVDPRTYVNNHLDQFHHIVRETPYDNNTLAFDKNELREDLSFKDGKYVIDVHRMFPGGSYHGNSHVNPLELAKNGSLKLQLSIAKEVQNYVKDFVVQPDGKVLIDPDSDIGKMLFAHDGNKATFLGKYAEIVHSIPNADGTEHIREIATIEGKGLTSLEDTVTTYIPRTDHTLDFLPQDIDYPYAIPLVGRKPLEKMEEGQPAQPVQPTVSTSGTQNNSQNNLQNGRASQNNTAGQNNSVGQNNTTTQGITSAQNSTVTQDGTPIIIPTIPPTIDTIDATIPTFPPDPLESEDSQEPIQIQDDTILNSANKEASSVEQLDATQFETEPDSNIIKYPKYKKGASITVRRSNGDIESGWFVAGTLLGQTEEGDKARLVSIYNRQPVNGFYPEGAINKVVYEEDLDALNADNFDALQHPPTVNTNAQVGTSPAPFTPPTIPTPPVIPTITPQPPTIPTVPVVPTVPTVPTIPSIPGTPPQMPTLPIREILSDIDPQANPHLHAIVQHLMQKPFMFEKMIDSIQALDAFGIIPTSTKEEIQKIIIGQWMGDTIDSIEQDVRYYEKNAMATKLPQEIKDLHSEMSAAQQQSEPFSAGKTVKNFGVNILRTLTGAPLIGEKARSAVPNKEVPDIAAFAKEVITEIINDGPRANAPEHQQVLNAFYKWYETEAGKDVDQFESTLSTALMSDNEIVSDVAGKILSQKDVLHEENLFEYAIPTPEMMNALIETLPEKDKQERKNNGSVAYFMGKVMQKVVAKSQSNFAGLSAKEQALMNVLIDAVPSNAEYPQGYKSFLEDLLKEKDITKIIEEAPQLLEAFSGAYDDIVREWKYDFKPLRKYDKYFSQIENGKTSFSTFGIIDESALNFSYTTEKNAQGREELLVLPTPTSWANTQEGLTGTFGEAFDFRIADVKGKPISDLLFKPAVMNMRGEVIQKGSVVLKR